MRKIFLALIALLMGALTANADSLVTVRPVATDSVDWAQLGVSETAIPSPFGFTTANGVSGLGAYANGTGKVLQQDISWYGNFAPRDFLNWATSNGAITLTFAQGYSQIGAQLAPGLYASFTAHICDASGCFTENNATGGNIYIGIDSSSPIDWVTFSLTSGYNFNSFAINEVTLDAPETVTPEPSSLLLFGSGLIGLAGALRRRLAR
jgi:hypothetical protein